MPGHTVTHAGCGEACRYRSLYEGSQQSLTDMAAQQASALGRATRLRQGSIDAIKRLFPRQFADAERDLGKRMQSVSDEMLLAYLEAFLGMAAAGAAPTGAELLRQALTDAGFALPDDVDLGAWADAVSARTARAGSLPSPAREVALPPMTAAPIAAPAPGSALPVASGSEVAPAWPAFDPEPPTTTGVPAHDQAPDTAGHGLAGLLDDPPGEPDLADLLDPTDDGLAGLLDDLPGEPDLADLLDPADVAQPAAVETAAPCTTELDALLEPASDSGADTPAAEAGAAAQWAPAPDNIPGPPLPDLADWVQQVGAMDLLDEDPFSDVPPLDAAPPAGDDLDELFREDPFNVPAPSGVPPAPATVAPVSAGGTDPLTANTPAAAPATAPARAATGTPTGPVKPQLFPEAAGARTTRRRPTRARRTQAQPPEQSGLDLPGATPPGPVGELTEQTRNALLAAVAVPRPVFVADLHGIGGSAANVQAWEAEQRDSSDSPVRFVPAKQRHRALGALVLPHGYARTAASEFRQSVWSECMTQLKGTVLYEVGVVLRSVMDRVVSSTVDGSTVVLRLTGAGQLTGVVISLAQNSGPGTVAGREVVDAVERLLTERLAHIAVLTVHADGVDPLVAAVSGEAQRRGWTVTAPVIAARSWEYVASSGATAVAVLGG